MKTIDDLITNNNSSNIIDGLFKYKGLYCLVAEPKVGKSFLSLQISDALVNGKKFLGLDVEKVPVLYVSTELSGNQLKDRLKITKYDLSKDFYYLEKDKEHRLCINDDLRYELSDFAINHNGKFVIIDVMCGIDYGCSFDINNYTDVLKNIFDKYRMLSEKYNLTFLLVHHLNKEGKTLGSTGIDSNMNGILSLYLNKDDTYTLKVVNRDFEGKEFFLTRNNNLEFEILKEDNSEMPFEMYKFIKYIMRKKDIRFTSSEMILELDLNMNYSVFGKLLNKNISNLEREGIILKRGKDSKGRYYTAKFIDPMLKNEYITENEEN